MAQHGARTRMEDEPCPTNSTLQANESQEEKVQRTRRELDLIPCAMRRRKEAEKGGSKARKMAAKGESLNPFNANLLRSSCTLDPIPRVLFHSELDAYPLAKCSIRPCNKQRMKDAKGGEQQ